MTHPPYAPMRGIIIGCLIGAVMWLAIIFGGAQVLGATIRPALTPASASNPIVARGCVIRYDTLNGAGTAVVPRIHEDAGHICVGVTSIGLEANGDLRIDNVGGPWKIVTAVVTVDESLAALGLICGVSGGGTVSIVRCYDRTGVRVRADSLVMYGAGRNIWFHALNWI